MAESRQAMFDLQLDTRKKIDGVLTKEQREQLTQYGHQRYLLVLWDDLTQRMLLQMLAGKPADTP